MKTSHVEQMINEGERLVALKQLLVAPLPKGNLGLVRKRLPDAEPRGAILLVHGFGQNRYTWHLSRRSLANYLVARGYDVFNLELRGHGRSRELGSPSPESFEQHVHEDLPAAVQVLSRLGYDQFFLFGHSLGGAVSYAVAPALGERLRGVVTLAGVYRWGAGTELISRIVPVLHAADRLHRVIGMGGGLPVRMDWVGRLLARNVELLEAGRLPMLPHAWAAESVEQEVLREWLHRAFDRTSGSVLALMGRWASQGIFCDTAGVIRYDDAWSRCTVPVLVIAADDDRLAHPERDVRPAYEASASPDRTYRCFGEADDGSAFGHIDLIIGRRAPELVWPTVAEWLDRH